MRWRSYSRTAYDSVLFEKRNFVRHFAHAGIRSFVRDRTGIDLDARFADMTSSLFYTVG
jgi:hypothetical protein